MSEPSAFDYLNDSNSALSRLCFTCRVATSSIEDGILAHDGDRRRVASWTPGPTETEDVRRRVGR